MYLNFQNLLFTPIIHILPKQQAMQQNFLLSGLLYVIYLDESIQMVATTASKVIFCILLFLKFCNHSDSNKSI